MATNEIQTGKSLDLPAPYAVTSGQGALIGTLFAVALVTLANGVVGAFKRDGVWDLTKNPAEAWTIGQRVYWDNTARRCTTTVSGNTLIGCAIAVAANPSDIGRVLLNGTA
jgi:predicted RecA/RadA family phage recombinase